MFVMSVMDVSKQIHWSSRIGIWRRSRCSTGCGSSPPRQRWHHARHVETEDGQCQPGWCSCQYGDL